MNSGLLKNSILFFLIMFPFLLLSQKKNKDFYKRSILDFTFTPISLFDPTHPQIRIGFDYFQDKDMSFNMDLGYGFTKIYKTFALDNNQFDKYNFFQIRPQIKVYVNRKRIFRLYVGFELFYMYENCVLNKGNVLIYKDGKQMGTIYFDNAKFKKNKYGFNLNFGFKFYSNKLFFIESYLGGGLFYIRTYAYDFENPVFMPYVYEKPTVYNISGNSLNLSFGIKLGVKLFYTKEKI